jgi:uncharacterized membrane protein
MTWRLFSVTIAALALAACGAANERLPDERRGATEQEEQQEDLASLAPPSAASTQAAPGAAPPSRSAPPTNGLALPERFSAVGTEPFWAAKVTGDRLTYMTPEDQGGQVVSITRTASGDKVELEGTLAGQRLSLVITAGPCSDGMSDRVYPFSVRRRLGDDEQRGCARPQ